MIINLDPDDEETDDAAGGTPRAPKVVPSTPGSNIASSVPQTPTTPNHMDSSNLSSNTSPEYHKQVNIRQNISKYKKIKLFID